MARITTTPATPLQIKPAALRNFHARLAAWYKAHGRHDLPWRQTTDPYHIWLSEVMLQQTQVATVRDRFYFPFLEKFPTIEALAAAEQTDVLKAWEGLGYYRRAGYLHEASKQIVRGEWWVVGGKKMPPLTTHYPRLTNLPGIGRNTAHAILAFAYHQPVAILEANVKRVVARIFALEKPSDTALWARAEQLLNHAKPFDYNQAMMDLGSLICTPKNPNCKACPARNLCRGKASPERYPAPKAKKQVPTREVTIHVREDAAGRLFLEKRDAALLGGLYGFPQHSGFGIQDSVNSENNAKTSYPTKKLAVDDVLSSYPESRILNPESSLLGSVTHTYSHFKLVGQVVHALVRAKTNSADWYTPEQIAALPLSKLDRKVLALVENCHRAKKKPAKLHSMPQAD